MVQFQGAGQLKIHHKKRELMKNQVVLNVTGISIEGQSTICLWGGRIGSINMDPTFLPIEHATKDNILRCVNDGGFGCKSIQSAEIDIYMVYEMGHREYVRTIYADSPIHAALFLGRRHLIENGIID